MLFFRFSLLPWNKVSHGPTVLIGVVIPDLASAEGALQQAIAGQQQARPALVILLGRYPAGEI